MKSSCPRARSNRLSGNRGTEIAEAAVVLPVLFLLLFSIYWFGRAFSIYGAINHAAREGARTAAVRACANCNAACPWQGSAQPCDAVVVQAVSNALLAAHLDPTQAQPFPPSPLPSPCPGVVPEGGCTTAAGSGITLCRNVVLDRNNPSPMVCGVMVSFRYPHQFVLPFTSLSNQQILLKAEAEMRGED